MNFEIRILSANANGTVPEYPAGVKSDIPIVTFSGKNDATPSTDIDFDF